MARFSLKRAVNRINRRLAKEPDADLMDVYEKIAAKYEFGGKPMSGRALYERVRRANGLTQQQIILPGEKQ